MKDKNDNSDPGRLTDSDNTQERKEPQQSKGGCMHWKRFDQVVRVVHGLAG